jgi:hypothetical protein
VIGLGTMKMELFIKAPQEPSKTVRKSVTECLVS